MSSRLSINLCPVSETMVRYRVALCQVVRTLGVDLSRCCTGLGDVVLGYILATLSTFAYISGNAVRLEYSVRSAAVNDLPFFMWVSVASE